MKLYGIAGASGFGREVMPLAAAMLAAVKENHELVFIDQNINERFVNNFPVMSFEEFYAHPANEKYFNIAIANHVSRKRIAEEMITRGIQPFTITATNHMQLGHNEIGEGAIFCGFTTVTANAKIGKFFHANIYSYVAHDCVIGDYVTFAPNVHCNGAVIIEDDAYLGTGAIIRQGTKDKPVIIGKGAVIGMGSVVTKSVPAFTTVIGNPARVMEAKVNSL